jgi:protein-S-isoprenylcysteine O-methyltransferase Ste14
MDDRKELNRVEIKDQVIELDPLDRVFYMRAILGLIAGISTGLSIAPGTPQGLAIGTAVLIGLIFYIVSYQIAKRIAKNIPKNDRRKLATNGIFPFIFMLIMFMIAIYTGLHENMPPLK